MKKSILIFNFILISFISYAQLPKLEWANGIGSKNNDYDVLIETDSSGNLIIVGTFTDTIDFDFGSGEFLLAPATAEGAIFILKLDSSGNFIWVNKIEGSGFTVPEQMDMDKDGNIYITGYFYNATDFDPGINTFILKSLGSSYTLGDAFVAKYNGFGNFIWARSFLSPSTARGLSITVDKLGNSYTCGKFKDSIDLDPGVAKYFLKSAGLYDSYICKLNPDGNFVWAKQFGADWLDEANCIAVDTIGNIYVSGIYYEPTDFDFGTGNFIMTPKGSADIFILKLGPQAQFIWAKSIGGPSADYMTGMVMDIKGNIFLIGSFQEFTDADPGVKNYSLYSKGSLDILLIKLTNNGEFVMARGIGGADNERAYDIDLDKNGNIFLTGDFKGSVDFDPGVGTSYSTSIGSGDMFVLKFDSNSNFVWKFNLSGSKWEWGESITLDNFGNIYTAGIIQTPVDCDPGTGKFEVINKGGNDIVIAKFKDYRSDSSLAIEKINNVNNGSVIQYPNPSSGMFSIKIDNPENDLSIKIYNLVGEEIKINKTNTTDTLYNVEINVADGIYLIRVLNGSTVWNKKVSVAR